MKKILQIIFSFFFGFYAFAQQSYYNDVNLTLNGTALRDALSIKIIATHTNPLNYSWEATQATDLNPTNNSNVLLIYGWENNSDGDCTNDVERGVNSNGGNVCDWNREHTYPNSLGTPKLENGGKNMTVYSDSHNLRASDVQRNGLRGNLRFASGTGTSKKVNSNQYWYPGDEWKGDVARILMYMYLRYGSQCLPLNVAVGSTNTVDSNMIDLLLQWNAEDPVSQYEKNRNEYHENTNNTYAQGNRNPFIDQPYLATLIWGGTQAEDLWGILSTDNSLFLNIELFPNPSAGQILNIQTNSDTAVTIFDLLGKTVLSDNISNSNNQIDISSLKNGIYIVRLKSVKGIVTKKFVKL